MGEKNHTQMIMYSVKFSYVFTFIIKSLFKNAFVGISATSIKSTLVLWQNM